MQQSLRRLGKVLFIFELHEIFCLFMLLFIILLFSFGANMSIIDILKHIAGNGSPITKLFFSLLTLLGLSCFIIPYVPLKKLAKFTFRMMSSFLIMLFSFESIIYFIRVRELPILDTMLQNWDNALLWGKPAAVWLEPLNHQSLVLFLSGAYLSWFIFLYGTVLLLLIKGRKSVIEYTAVALLTFYIGYIGYLLIPAIGPYYAYEFSTPMGGVLTLLTNSSIYTPSADVFPSLHTALAIVMLVEIWRHYRIWTWLYAPMTTLVIISTVFLRIHYVVDVIAGVLLAIITLWITPKLLSYWDKGRVQLLANAHSHMKSIDGSNKTTFES